MIAKLLTGLAMIGVMLTIAALALDGIFKIYTESEANHIERVAVILIGYYVFMRDA